MAEESPTSEVNLWPEVECIAMDIFTAASCGAEEKVREEIERFPNKDAINKRNREGWTSLMYAAANGNSDVAMLLLEKGASLVLTDKQGLTALMLAAKCGSVTSVHYIIEAGADLDARDADTWTALFYAAYAGHLSVVSLLVQKGCSINTIEDKNGVTPLMLACAAGHERVAHYLLHNGADAAMCSKAGETARGLAIRFGHDRVKLTIDAYLYTQRQFEQSGEAASRKVDVFSVLQDLGLTKYYTIFKKHQIDLEAFWTLTDKDLREIGIELLGPRKKILIAIERWKECTSMKTEDEALVRRDTEENRQLQQELSQAKRVLRQMEDIRVALEGQLSQTSHRLNEGKEHMERMVLHIGQTIINLRNCVLALKTCIYTVLQEQNTAGQQNAIYPGANSSQMLVIIDAIEKMLNYLQSELATRL